MSQVIEEQVIEFVRKELPLMTTLFLKKIEVGESSALQDIYEPEDIDQLMEKYFQRFNIDIQGFSLEYYLPWKTKSFLSGKKINENKKPLTIAMLIESAKEGHWLYD